MEARIELIEKEKEISEAVKNLAISFLEEKMRLHPELTTRIELMICDQISIWSSKNAVIERRTKTLLPDTMYCSCPKELDEELIAAGGGGGYTPPCPVHDDEEDEERIAAGGALGGGYKPPRTVNCK